MSFLQQTMHWGTQTAMGSSPCWWKEDAVWIHGEQGELNLLRESIGSSLSLCSLWSKLILVRYQTKLCCTSEWSNKIKTLLFPRASTEVRNAKGKEDRNSCQSRRESTMRIGTAYSQITAVAYCVSAHRGMLDVNTFCSHCPEGPQTVRTGSSTYPPFYRVSVSCNRLLCVCWS